MAAESELPQEDLTELLKQLNELLEPLGVEVLGALIHEDPTPDDELEPGEERYHRVIASLQFLPERAFSVAVLDPETDEMRDKFRDIKSDAVVDEARAAVDEFLREREERKGK